MSADTLPDPVKVAREAYERSIGEPAWGWPTMLIAWENGARAYRDAVQAHNAAHQQMALDTAEVLAAALEKAPPQPERGAVIVTSSLGADGNPDGMSFHVVGRVVDGVFQPESDKPAPSAIADALEACEWPDIPIGNKAVLRAAIASLRAFDPGLLPPAEDRSEEERAARIAEINLQDYAKALLKERRRAIAAETALAEIRALAQDRLTAIVGLEEELAASRALCGSRAATDVLAERRRQINEEGWTPEHDNVHSEGQIASAAGLYALNVGHAGIPLKDRIAGVPKLWPWERHWWKPKDRRRDLVRAGALIIAEIERLDRDAAREAR